MSSQKPDTYFGCPITRHTKTPKEKAMAELEKLIADGALERDNSKKQGNKDKKSDKKKKANPRLTRSLAALETLICSMKGKYVNEVGEEVDISSQVEAAKKRTVWVRSDDVVRDVLSTVEKQTEKKTSGCGIHVTEESSLEAARRLHEEGHRVLVLNFASAKHPGGGYLTGSMAQEEALCLCSSLFPSISQITEHYDINGKTHDGIYTDHMLYSPDVPVFRRDNLSFYDAPFPVSFITSPAVNAGVVMQNGQKDKAVSKAALLDVVNQCMTKRIRRILEVAAASNHTAVVLGAFGCGVFRNDPVCVCLLCVVSPYRFYRFLSRFGLTLFFSILLSFSLSLAFLFLSLSLSSSLSFSHSRMSLAFSRVSSREALLMQRSCSASLEASRTPTSLPLKRSFRHSRLLAPSLFPLTIDVHFMLKLLKEKKENPPTAQTNS